MYLNRKQVDNNECLYCSNLHDYPLYGDNEIEFFVQDNVINIDIQVSNTYIHKQFDVKFCPMCGRYLK